MIDDLIWILFHRYDDDCYCYCSICMGMIDWVALAEQAAFVEWPPFAEWSVEQVVQQLAWVESYVLCVVLASQSFDSLSDHNESIAIVAQYDYLDF